MTGKWFGLVASIVVLALGCGQSEEANPDIDEQNASAAVKAMLDLSESGDWDTYVDLYYGEIQKIGSPDERRALVLRFEEKWGSQVVVALREASEITPVVEGTRAVFRVGDRVVLILYKNDKGKWTFHL